MKRTGMIRQLDELGRLTLPIELRRSMDLSQHDALEITLENDAIVLRKQFKHKTFEERLAEYNGKISSCDFDWGNPKGKELL